MKKHLCILGFAMLLSVAGAFAQNCDYSGTTGTLEWCLKDGTLTISGEGEMPDYDTPWENYRESITTVIIENGVTRIGDYAFFSGNSDYAITSISIPNSVTSIGYVAFARCTVLPSIVIPSSVTSIGTSVFIGCAALTSINVESENPNYSSDNGILFNKDKTTIICHPAGKTESSYNIPNSVTCIERNAFCNCKNLTLVNIPNSVTSIKALAFQECSSLSSIDIPNGVTTIEEMTFIACSALSSVSIPNSVTTIGSDAFSDCIDLTSITALNLVPIVINYRVFGYPPIDITAITLEVPTSAVPDYQAAEVWQEMNIVGGGMLVNPVPGDPEEGYTEGDGLYSGRATATVTAVPRNNYKFVNWTINGVEVSRDNPYSFTVTEDVELVANFERTGYSVTVSVNNEEYGTATGGGVYEENATATVTATAYDGYKFVNWTKDGVEISTDNPYSFTVTEDVELVANFEEGVGIAPPSPPEGGDVRVYPNPTDGQLRITNYELRTPDNKIADIEIFDVFGRQQLSTLNFQLSTQINISHLPAGVYFIRITTDDGVVTRKVVKQ